MTTEHPIVPPTELVEQWAHLPADWNTVASLIAQWGADQELEACLNWLADRERFPVGHEAIEDLKGDRRPSQLSLKSHALKALDLLKQRTTDPSIIEPLLLAVEQLND
jgi:hypothetical protein